MGTVFRTRCILCAFFCSAVMFYSHTAGLSAEESSPSAAAVPNQAGTLPDTDRCLCSMSPAERNVLLSNRNEEMAATNRDSSVVSIDTRLQNATETVCLIGKWDGYPGRYCDVWADGNYAYLPNWRLADGQPARVHVIDISNPGAPVLDETLFIPSPNDNASPQDVKVGDGLLFVALEGDGDDSAVIYDVRNPASRQLLVAVRIPGFQFLHNLFYDSGYLYLQGGTSVAIVDLTGFDPDNPPDSTITTAKWTINNVGTSFIHDLTVKNGRLYVAAWHSGLWIYDVSDVANTLPSFLGSVGGQSTHSMWPSDDGQFVVTGEERSGGGLHVYRITDNGGSVTLTLTDTLTLTGASSVHNQVMVGNRLYNSWYSRGMEVYDIDTNGLLNHVASYNTSDSGLGNWGIYPLLGSDRILLSDGNEGLYIVSVGTEPCVCFPSSPPELQTQFTSTLAAGDPEPKNRFIAIKAGDVGLQQAIRVTWDAQPNWEGGHAALVGQAKWMTEPFQVCENSSDGFANAPPNCGPAPGQPQKWFWAARLVCDPTSAHYGNLTTLTDFCTGSGEGCTSDANCASGTCGVDGVIHLFDQGIVPSKNANQQAIYSVQLIESACGQDIEGNFSNALVVTQPKWGDIGSNTGCPMAPPNGAADLVPDVTRALGKFSNDFCAPKKSRSDVSPATLDMQTSITDVLELLNAFGSGSESYGFAAGPVCPAGT